MKKPHLDAAFFCSIAGRQARNDARNPIALKQKSQILWFRFAESRFDLYMQGGTIQSNKVERIKKSRHVAIFY